MHAAQKCGDNIRGLWLARREEVMAGIRQKGRYAGPSAREMSRE